MTASAERSRRLWELVKHQRFWCETCNGVHPLTGHRACRARSVTALVAQARQAITREDTHD